MLATGAFYGIQMQWYNGPSCCSPPHSTSSIPVTGQPSNSGQNFCVSVYKDWTTAALWYREVVWKYQSDFRHTLKWPFCNVCLLLFQGNPSSSVTKQPEVGVLGSAPHSRRGILYLSNRQRPLTYLCTEELFLSQDPIDAFRKQH